MEFELNLSLKELEKRTSKEYLRNIEFLSANAPQYTSLSDNDKKILALLDNAGQVFDIIYLKQDNKHNIAFMEFLNKEIKKGNKRAELTKILFEAQKGMFSPDYEGNQIKLAKNINKNEFLNFYPDDLTPQSYHQIINQMLDNKEYDKVRAMVSQRTMIRWQDNKLVAIDYVDYFKEEFVQVSTYLLAAAKLCDKTEKKFAKFLKLQAKALLYANPKLDAKADILWAQITDSKFEFTITRECYDDNFTSTILENEQLYNRLKSLKIEVYSKDCLGARVGLVNKEGTLLLEKLKSLSNIAEKHMPLRDKYVSINNQKSKTKQTALDVDIVNLYGDEGEYKAGIVLAQNLPNNDKLSQKMGGGRKNIYHRQVRLSGDNHIAQLLLNKSDLCYYKKSACHLATICHENTHSLGPKSHTLGKYSSIIEEFKADMGMFSFLHEFVNAGEFTEIEAKEIIVSDLTDSFLKAKPILTQAHKVRTVMILNRFFQEKALSLDTKNKLVFDFDKIIETSKIMMKELVELQLIGSVSKTEKYIDKYFKWTKDMQTISDIKRKHSKYLNGKTTAPLSCKLKKLII